MGQHPSGADARQAAARSGIPQASAAAEDRPGRDGHERACLEMRPPVETFQEAGAPLPKGTLASPGPLPLGRCRFQGDPSLPWTRLWRR